MGKLRSPTTPPSRSAPRAFPRMDPPPPYEAASSRSSSAHSLDPLQARESTPSQQQNTQSTALTQSQPTEQQRAPEADHQDRKRRTEEGCMTFGEGASGCMVVGKNAEGCMNYGDNTSGWYVCPVTMPALSTRVRS
ncbi:hypothetical protein A1O7_07918 [Cladophialophora yegresii CBS 114405]|uniref:Uncharacterized protein n=1 Tax=Cladophialophora yegresii CBS 114405 TaxID=1182544 RepID=W9VXY1_9EURO|nr:uncharacterized protein A1O7_07918 [Cladophialophora yegresii CBS 114405]EXJ57570.1 hypothetical protein A1O7_07918 [Cladophialophora yegresii CBS 114405]